MSNLPSLLRSNLSAGRRAGTAVALIFAAAWVYAPIVAQHPHWQDTETDLSRQQFSTRQRATLRMWRQRDQSRDEVQRAARDPDPEVAGRAQWILRQWRRGALPDMPPEIRRQLQRGDDPAAIERLIDGGQFLAAVVAVEESAGTINRESIQRRITAALQRRFPIYISLALGNESVPELLKLIELVADSSELALCRIELMQRLGMAIDEASLLPLAAETWTAADRDRTRALLLITIGRFDAAIEVAQASGDEKLLYDCRVVVGRWQEVAAHSLAAAMESEVGSLQHSQLWCQTLIAADRCGDTRLRDRAIDELNSPEATKNAEVADLRWKCLASHGEVDKAFLILDQLSGDTSASASIDASRVERAFDVLGYPLDRVDLDAIRWTDQAIEAQRDSIRGEPCQELRNILALVHCLSSVGRDDAAWIIAKRLCQAEVHIESHRLREYVLSSLTLTRRSDWLIRLAVDPDEKDLSATSRETISRTLPDADVTTLEIVMESLATLMPRQSLDHRLSAAAALLSGEIPTGFDPDVDFQRMHDIVTHIQTTPSTRGRRVARQKIQANLNIVRMFSRHGQTELASSCLEKLSQTGNTEALFLLAERALDAGRAETALTLFHSVFNTILRQGRLNSTIAGSDDVTLAAKALVGLWILARRAGDQELSSELLHQLRLILCSPDPDLRDSLASYLADRDESGLAVEAYQTLLPLLVFNSEDAITLYAAARSYALAARKTDPENAARWFDLAVTRAIESDDFRAGAFITLPMYVRRWSIEAAIDQKHESEVRRHIDRLLQLDPLDIDLAERLLPRLRQAGMQVLADETFDRIMDRGLQYTDRFSFDAMTCNNLAWVSAMNGRRLDDALRLAKTAVRVEPESAIYRDTLAEVLFLLGRQTEALQLEQGCLLDDPGQWHLHQQIKKYQTAIASQGS